MKFLCLPFNCASKHTSAPTPPPPTKSHQNLTHSQSDTVSSASGMVADPQTPQEYSADERAKSTPPQGTQYSERPGDPSTHKCNDLAEWFQHTPASVTGEREGTKMVRTFYTSRKTPGGDINVWYADGEFGFYESVPKRIADLCATHVLVEYPNQWGVNPRIELYVQVTDPETRELRAIRVHELIQLVMRDDEQWERGIPENLIEWELIFPERESWCTMRIVGYPDWPGTSRLSPQVDSVAGGNPAS